MTFGSESTTDEVLGGVDLSGLLVLITGASAGIGQETARALAAHGAGVVLGVRDLEKGERAAGEVRAAAARTGATVFSKVGVSAARARAAAASEYTTNLDLCVNLDLILELV